MLGDISRKLPLLCCQIHCDPPCLLIHGSGDQTVPLSETTDFYEILKENNRTTELHIYADEGHAFDGERIIGRNVVDVLGIFFKKYL